MRNDTEHIYHRKVNQVIDYISARLEQPLPLARLARHIGVSERQLLRIMRSALSESLAAYIARQRVERSVLYLQSEKMSLAHLAEKVGYDNPQSFSKAFKKHFGISPKTYLHELQQKLQNFVQNGENTQALESEICEIEERELVYIRIVGRYGESELYNAAWGKLVGFLIENQAFSAETRFIGISFDSPNVTRSEQCRFYACACVQKAITPKGEFGTIRLQRGRYAVFTHKGSYAGLQALYNNISLNFAHTLRFGLAFEEYVNSRHDTKEEDLLTKIFIPIQ
ncbi:MAG: GyrI-like domain-containing protein [Bacteroidales bacterium]|nr:GyrI-like domain-containing protein [Bacteroidales bacterium]